MASTATPRELMSAMIEDRTATRRAKNIHMRVVNGVKYITSYGDHFVLAYQEGENWRVTHAKYSATTSTHQRGIREALYDHGFAPTGQFNMAGYELWTQ